MSGRGARRAGWSVAWAAFLGAAGCQVLFGVDAGDLPGQSGGGGEGTGGAGAAAGMGPTPQQGAGGSTAASGAGGTGGTGGLGGQGGIGGLGGQGGASGSSGAGGQPAATCHTSKGEFSAATAPESCFFFLAEGSKAEPPSLRTEWTWDEARDDCNALGARLASLAVGAEFEELRQYMYEGGDDLPIDGKVWIGARMDGPMPATPQELAYLFIWQSGEPWTYHTYGEWPWHDGEPSLNVVVPQRCIAMPVQFGYQMDNGTCEDRLPFVLCERDATAARGR